MDIFDMPEYNRTTEEDPVGTEDTSYTYDTNTQYNTGDNLNDDDYFDYTGKPPPVPTGRSLEEITKDWENWEKKERIININKRDLNTYLSKSGWTSIERGRELVAKRINVKGGHLYFVPDQNKRYFDPALMSDRQIANLELDKSFRLTKLRPMGVLFDYDGLVTRYGKPFADYFKNLLEGNWVKPKELSYQDFLNQHMDNEPSMRQTQPQQLSPEALKLIEEFKKFGIKPIRHIEDLDKHPEELELFDKSALRELIPLLKAGDELAEAKQVRDMKIMELQDELSKLNRKNFETEEAYEKEKEELMDKLIEEKKRAWDIGLLRESQTTRIRRLFVEVIKNSKIPLKDKLQIIF